MTFMSAGSTDPQSLGAAVRQARDVHGWTQAELAERAGVSRAFVLDLERGARSRAELGRVLAVVRALGLAVALVDDRRPDDFDEVLDQVLG
jgi:transcriptional regulator with XRE-family HTH domain